MSGEIQETLAIAINYLIDEGKLMNPPKSYLDAVKQCGGKTCLTPVERWSTSEDTPWAEVISAPRTMSGGECAQTRAASASVPRATSARNSDPQPAPRPNVGDGQQTMAQRVRPSTPPATGKQRLGQAMADFGQSASNRGLSPAICGGQRGTIPAKPAPACGYTLSTTGAPTKSGGQRVALKLKTGKHIFVAKPKPPELPKDAYNDDFPTLSGREAANRWDHKAVPVQSSSTGPPPKSVVPAAKGPKVEAPRIAPKAAGAGAVNTGGAQEDAIPWTVESRTLGPRFRRQELSRALWLAHPCRQSPVTRNCNPDGEAMFQELPARTILSRRVTLHPCRPMRR